MAFEATINGVVVRSDKSCSGITNTRVSFSDGSWCDVETGQVVSQGRGYISIGNTGAQTDNGSEQQTTTGPTSFAARALRLSNIAARVLVSIHDGPDMVVEMTGRPSSLEAIKCSVSGEVLTIESEDSSSVSGGISISATTSSISFIGGSSPRVSGTVVRVKVPVHCPIRVIGGHGHEVEIGDTEDSLTVNLTGSGSVKAGRVTDSVVSITGSASVDIAHVCGMVSVQVQGSGDVSIDDGEIRNLVVSTMGSGSVNIGGIAEAATLSSMGSSKITVDHVRQEPSKTQMGTGSITVHRTG